MGLVNKILPHYTYEDWVHWDGIWELIEGHPIAMSPTPVPKHQRIAAELRTELTLALRKSNCQDCHAYDPLDYKISDDTILIPDILIICGKVTKKYLDFPPSLIVEILSPATALRDRHTKYQLYEQQSVRNYIIVDPDKETIETFELTQNHFNLTSHENGYKFLLSDNCTIAPEFSNIFN
jgi:Uma2 family endonuclease